MGRVALVLPDRQLQELARQLLAETGEDALVYGAVDFHPEHLVSRARQEGAVVLVAPPPLARGLREVGLLPVVDLEPTAFELADALSDARDTGKPIVFIHFGTVEQDGEALSRLADAPVRSVAVSRDAGAVRRKILELAEGGPLVVVGGRTTVDLAGRLGIPGVAVAVGKAALVEALKRARAVTAALAPARADAGDEGWVPGPIAATDVNEAVLPGDELPLHERVVALSAAMSRAVALADEMAANSSPALIWGELGSGKSFLCRYIHWRSGMGPEDLCVVQCGGTPASLKGTLGAWLDKGDGRKGTLVLEQVEELPPEWQSALFHLTEREAEQSVRILATTRGGLKEAVAAQRFREELYWRLGVLQLRVPPLRERREDLAPLLVAFWAELAGEPLPLTPQGLERLSHYRWPGNVRELRNFVQRYWVLWKGLPLFPAEEREKMALDDFLSAVEEESLRAPIHVLPGTLESMEAQIMHEMARRIQGSKAEVARRLGISRTTLWKRLKEAGRAGVSGEGML